VFHGEFFLRVPVSVSLLAVLAQYLHSRGQNIYRLERWRDKNQPRQPEQSAISSGLSPSITAMMGTLHGFRLRLSISVPACFRVAEERRTKSHSAQTPR